MLTSGKLLSDTIGDSWISIVDKVLRALRSVANAFVHFDQIKHSLHFFRQIRGEVDWTSI